MDRYLWDIEIEKIPCSWEFDCLRYCEDKIYKCKEATVKLFNSIKEQIKNIYKNKNNFEFKYMINYIIRLDMKLYAILMEWSNKYLESYCKDIEFSEELLYRIIDNSKYCYFYKSNKLFDKYKLVNLDLSDSLL